MNEKLMNEEWMRGSVQFNPLPEAHVLFAEAKCEQPRLIAYTIGPYRDARGPSFIDANIQRARTLAKLLWNHGYTVICPQANSAFFDGCAKDEAFLEGYLQLLALCDVAFIVPKLPVLGAVKNSAGSQREIALCKERNIPLVSVHLEAGGIIVLPEAWRYGDERRTKA